MFEYSKAYKPFEYPWAVDLVKEHEKVHWIEDEVDLSEDVYDWNHRLTEVEKGHLVQILRIFTESDVVVGQYYYESLIPAIRNNELRNMLGSFAAREGIHQRAYALLNDTLGLPESEYSAFRDYFQSKDKIEYMGVSGDDFAGTVAKGVFNEGVMLFGSFVMLLNYSRFGKMKGMCTITEWSLRDESIHVAGLVELYKAIGLKVDLEKYARACYELECSFVDLVYEMGMVEGLAVDEVKQYLAFMVDYRLVQLGGSVIYGASNPLKWLDDILNGMDFSNFFEKRVTEYGKGLGGEWDYE